MYKACTGNVNDVHINFSMVTLWSIKKNNNNNDV